VQDPTRPGSQTTEFRTTLVAQFLASAVALVTVLSGDDAGLSNETQQVIVAFAVSSWTLSQIAYGWSRTRLKRTAVQASAEVEIAQIMEIHGAGDTVKSQDQVMDIS
jgi:hypothetical protein